MISLSNQNPKMFGKSIFSLDALKLAKLLGSTMNNIKKWKSIGKKETFYAFSDICYLDRLEI